MAQCAVTARRPLSGRVASTGARAGLGLLEAKAASVDTAATPLAARRSRGRSSAAIRQDGYRYRNCCVILLGQMGLGRKVCGGGFELVGYGGAREAGARRRRGCGSEVGFMERGQDRLAGPHDWLQGAQA